jgi:hypothetical protein
MESNITELRCKQEAVKFQSDGTLFDAEAESPELVRSILERESLDGIPDMDTDESSFSSGLWRPVGPWVFFHVNHYLHGTPFSFHTGKFVSENHMTIRWKRISDGEGGSTWDLERVTNGEGQTKPLCSMR